MSLVLPSGWFIDYHAGRMQPYTVWHKALVWYFAESLEQAQKYVWRQAAREAQKHDAYLGDLQMVTT